MDLKGKTVVLGMSGGVDSSVCAVLLKKQGANVIGLFMKNWEELDEAGNCQASKEYEDVKAVCDKIDIPYYSVNFVKEYKERVFDDFLKDFGKGLTPNPDILCNREIKFDVFFKKALTLGADFVATGHYCQNNNSKLVKGEDSNKDQTYFLHAIKSDVLEKVLFPIGDLPKTQVRELAEKYNLKTKHKKDSTGICFIGERNFKPFLQQYLKTRPGNFVNLQGEVQGTHSGAVFYTLGQRRGLGLGGPGERWYVVAKNIDQNTVTVERGADHPALYADSLKALEITWISPDQEIELPFTCQAKIRYRQKDQLCTIEKIENGEMLVTFDTPQRAITPGQSIVFYKGNICLGGAKITTIGASYFQMNKELMILQDSI
ncbi:MAG: tRNA 2-thiouridine(34) synthase MnmA [Epsilonproteobacteria bacterium]|nr:MAG: tRNA 2-thiouridine(34) synthase MnmA [Campylobacterota bacterium]RLA67090.1 MAG: tRNA 2-thiouridine(34) synthase MnmA [Campylobacterota bacterium]